MNTVNMFYKTIIEKLKSSKNIEILIALVIIAIIISLYTSTFDKSVEASKEQSITTNAVLAEKEGSIQDPIEVKLTKILKSIEGAGEVEVMITYESGPEVVPAMDTEKNDTNTQENDSNNGKRITQTTNESRRPVTIQQNSGTEPLILMEKMPEVRGVIVIAEGAKNIRVKMDLLRAVETVLRVPPNRVEVFAMGR
ncbi:MAG: stage III sporulation protein AG [Clostridia bacterium]